MNTGITCPKCGKFELWLMSTLNQWKYYCEPCNTRFNENLRPMHAPNNVSDADPDTDMRRARS
jgi:transcription elongation factor Elf1